MFIRLSWSLGVVPKRKNGPKIYKVCPMHYEMNLLDFLLAEMTFFYYLFVCWWYLFLWNSLCNFGNEWNRKGDWSKKWTEGKCLLVKLKTIVVLLIYIIFTTNRTPSSRKITLETFCTVDSRECKSIFDSLKQINCVKIKKNANVNFALSHVMACLAIKGE